MKHNFIKFRSDSVNLAKIFESSLANCFTESDIADGSLVIGTMDCGRRLAMGWLRGIIRSEVDGSMLYNIVNAIEGDEHTKFIGNARLVTRTMYLPRFASSINGSVIPRVGWALTCNGEKVKLTSCDDQWMTVASESIHSIEPLFKETK